MGEQRWIVVPEVLMQIAAPALNSAALVHAPLLLDGLTADVLDCAALREAVCQCLTSQRPVIAVVRDDAQPILHSLTDADSQLWIAVPDGTDARAALLENLIAEAAMRF